eukprot:327348-Rhodomonas_salina.3
MDVRRRRSSTSRSLSGVIARLSATPAGAMARIMASIESSFTWMSDKAVSVRSSAPWLLVSRIRCLSATSSVYWSSCARAVLVSTSDLSAHAQAGAGQ